MLNLVIWVFVALFLGLGFLSCFINKIPGPILVFLGVLVAQLGLDHGPGWGAVAIIAAIAHRTCNGCRKRKCRQHHHHHCVHRWICGSAIPIRIFS